MQAHVNMMECIIYIISGSLCEASNSFIIGLVRSVFMIIAFMHPHVNKAGCITYIIFGSLCEAFNSFIIGLVRSVFMVIIQSTSPFLRYESVEI